MENLVRRQRESRSLTQKKLGECAGVSRQMINAIETGEFGPSLWLAHDLARFFSTSIETLFAQAHEKRWGSSFTMALSRFIIAEFFLNRAAEAITDFKSATICRWKSRTA